jgi:mannose-1-phosphate guanylyltransferase
MAGGSGTRFWPLSRRDRPKQFLALGGPKSLIRETFERLAPLAGAKRTWVVAGDLHVKRVRAELPEIPAANILAEPEGRNTAPCIGLAAHRILRQDPDAMLLVCPADHVIHPREAFAASVGDAVGFLAAAGGEGEPWTVTFGIPPRYPATGFGYMERGDGLAAIAPGFPGHAVNRFKEKPDADLAASLVASGRWYWNSGIFLWKARGLLDLIERHLPGLSAGLRTLDSEAGKNRLLGALRARFPALPSISIDHGVLEKSQHVAVLPAGFEWDDVGSWLAVERYAARDAAGNSVMGRHLGVETRDSIIVSGKRLVATVGVQGLVIVETDDAILVCDRAATEKIKGLVEALHAGGLEEHV